MVIYFGNVNIVAENMKSVHPQEEYGYIVHVASSVLNVIKNIIRKEYTIKMKFPLINLYNLNRCKPIVQVKGIEGLLQWDYCDLEGLPPERVGSRDGMPTMTDMGKPAPGQYENLPKTFFATNGGEYFIKNIIKLKSSK